MGAASIALNHAVSPSSDGSSSAPLAGARVVVKAAIAAVAFTLASSTLLQGVATWRAWQSAAPIRVSITALQAVTQARWSIDAPGAEVNAPGVAAVAALEKSIALQEGARQLVRRPAGETRFASKARSTLIARVASEKVLLQLALQNSERVIRLWTAEPVSLPARGPAKSRIEVAASGSSKHQEVITDRLTIPSAKVMASHSEPLATPVVPVEMHELQPVVAERPLVLAPAVAMSETSAVQAVTAMNIQRPSNTDADRVSGAQPENTRMKRLTKTSRDDAWVVLSSPGQPSIVFAQTNTGAIREFPSVDLNIQTDKNSHGKSAGASIRSSAGVVSGWIPAATEVRVRGASRVDYYSRDGRTPAPESHGERYFVARNLRPGAAVVQVAKEADGDVATSAGVPVLASSATQIDLRQVQSVRIRGHLWSSESSEPRGVAHAEIRLVGLPHHLAVSNEDGSFDLGEAVLPIGLAAFIEARLPGGYTHRYAVDPTRASKPLRLFLFSDERIQGLLGSLEGGVSAESGLIMASVRADQIQGVRPVIRPLVESSESAPETYWLNPDGTLREPSRAPSTRGAFTQWIGVEVTAKSVLAGLQSTRGRWHHVEWVPTSPGVISVLSPVE